MIPAKIVATGFYAPPKVETAAELAPRLKRSERWIRDRTGVVERHISEEPVEGMSAKAARAALGDGPPPDLLINASTSPRQMIPDTSVFVARELGLEGVATFSVHSTCLSFMPALQIAAAHVGSGMFRRVLIVSSEVASVARNFEEPESASLLADGAAAVVVEATPAGEASAILGMSMGTYPDGIELTELRGFGSARHPLDPATERTDYFFTMNGPGVVRMARQHTPRHIVAALQQAGLKDLSEIDLAVPHQASSKAIALIANAMGFPSDRIVNIVAEYGNTIAASMPMALAHAARTGRLRRGAHVLLVGTGAGLCVGAAVLRY